MKQILLSLMLICNLQLVAQDSTQRIKITCLGVEPIALQFDSLTTKEIYSRALKWFQTIYQDANKPKISVVENESITVNGAIEKAFAVEEKPAPFIFDVEYSLQIAIKENSARLAFEVGQIWWHRFDRKAEFTYQRFFKPDGETRKLYVASKEQLEKSINTIVQEFYQDLKIGAKTRARQTNNTSEIFAVLDNNAEPQGGLAEFYKFLQDNVVYPEQARRSGVSGKVIFKFVVEPDGSLTNIEIVQSLFKDCDNELIRVLRLCPNWIPGEVAGKKVRQGYTMSFNFKLQ